MELNSFTLKWCNFIWNRSMEVENEGWCYEDKYGIGKLWKNWIKEPRTDYFFGIFRKMYNIFEIFLGILKNHIILYDLSLLNMFLFLKLIKLPTYK